MPKTEPTPSEDIDNTLEVEELQKELLNDLPELLPPHRFRLRHRAAFNNLMLNAAKSGAFDRDQMDFDLTNPDDITEFQKLQDFIVQIDEWAETVATDPTVYAAWSEGKTEEHFLALFRLYQEALGESNGSGD